MILSSNGGDFTKKKMPRIITKGIRQTTWNLMVLCFLCILCSFILFWIMASGENITSNDEIYMYFYADSFIVGEKNSGLLHISFSDTDMSKVEITEEDIFLKDFLPLLHILMSRNTKTM